MKLKKIFQGFLISLFAIVLLIILLEIGIRFFVSSGTPFPSTKPKSTSGIPLYILSDNQMLYCLNPEHPSVSSQGTRDKEYAIPKPRDTLRILILGDSVAYGDFVKRDYLFSEQLEKNLNPRYGKVEVIDAGAQGYTPFNELHYYRNKGARFQSDIVILSFCFNDVVNPRLHWNYTTEAITNIPKEAIPNPEYDRYHVLPILKAREHPSLLMKSALYRFFYSRINRMKVNEKRYSHENGKKYPVYITGEDTISIKVLLDYSSPEWNWLRSILNQLKEAVKRDGATFVILIVPLAYQLEEDYPYFPQKLIQRYCEENSIYFLDLLPAFRKNRGERIFIGAIAREGFRDYVDIWHLTPRGHLLAAKEIKAFLLRTGLLQAK